MDEFLKHVAGEWETIKQAPLIFLAAVLVIGAMIYAALRWQYGARIDHLEARIRLRDDELRQFKNELHVSTPDEAARKIEELLAKTDTR
jgi:hypothetical protein